ncbi:MAG: hypothetical protein E7B59_12530 [Enterobacteriaceae bacterium]|nr:hypothetical protein [Enterobacteriaceae bacterium]
MTEREKFEAWNNDVDCPLAGVSVKDGAWRSWQAATATKNTLPENVKIYTASPSDMSPPVDDKSFCVDFVLATDYLALREQAVALAAEIAELEQYRTAYLEWSNKTDWVQGDKRFDVVKPLGKHRADVLREYIEHLEKLATDYVKKSAQVIRELEREKDARESVALALRDDMRAARTLTVKLPLMLASSPHFNGGVESTIKALESACAAAGIKLQIEE